MFDLFKKNSMFYTQIASCLHMKNSAMKISRSPSDNEACFALVRALVILTVFLAFLSGCAMQSVAIKGESVEVSVTKTSKIAVVENPSLDTFVSSAELKEDITSVLKKEGFQVVDSEDQADLVVLPLATILSSDEQDATGRGVRDLSSSVLFRSGFDDIGDPSVARRLGISSLDSRSELTKSRVGMSVTAISKEAWVNLKPGEPLPIVWRVVATADLTRGKEIEASQALLAAMGNYLGKNTGGFVLAKVPPNAN